MGSLVVGLGDKLHDLVFESFLIGLDILLVAVIEGVLPHMPPDCKDFERLQLHPPALEKYHGFGAVASVGIYRCPVMRLPIRTHGVFVVLADVME